MKRLLIIFCVFVSAISSWSTEVNIKFIEVESIYQENDRSLSLQPYASHDGNIIHLYSDFPIETMQVTVKDSMGNILSWETIALNPEQPYTFSIGDVATGVYMLELNDGRNKYRGYFEIDF